MNSILWLVALILFGVVEAATVGLASIWFACGALVALIVSAFTDVFMVQLVAFLVVSLIALILARPLARRYLDSRHVPTNADRVIGKEAVVTQDIDNLRGMGEVKVAGQPWTARAQELEGTIPQGTTVRVLRIEGVKLLVEPKV